MEIEIPEECPFEVGIDSCKLVCFYNILGMCTKKGSKNHPLVKPFTNFHKIKMMNLDEMASFLNKVSTDCSNYCVYGNECNGKCEKGIKEWLEQ